MSSVPPNLYDTTNLDASNSTQMMQMVASDVVSGTPYSLIGPNATAVQQGADAINGATGPGASVAAPQTVSPGTGSSPTTLQNIEAGALTAFGMTTNPIMGAQTAVAAGAPTAVTQWIQSHLGNWGLVGIGVVLGLGALLISQKQTIVTVGKQAAKMGLTGT